MIAIIPTQQIIISKAVKMPEYKNVIMLSFLFKFLF